MQSKQSGPMHADNPFFGREMKSRWAHLSRIGGDRVAILFEELRRKVGAIEGLGEELIFAGEIGGWMPTYSLDGKALFSAEIGAGLLAIVMHMEKGERDQLLASKRLSLAMKRALDAASSDGGDFLLRFDLKNRGDVAAVTKLVSLRSRIRTK